MHIFPLMDLGIWSQSVCMKCKHFVPVYPLGIPGATPEKAQEAAKLAAEDTRQGHRLQMLQELNFQMNVASYLHSH
jgi:hypothetical protein